MKFRRLASLVVMSALATISGAAELGGCALCGAAVQPEALVNASLSARPSFLFNELSAQEMADAERVLRSSLPALGDSAGSKSLSSDRLHSLDLVPPPKAAALAYLDGSSPAPGRYARAIVVRGSQGDVMEYQVGPLAGGGANATVVPLRQPGEIPFAKRPGDPAEFATASARKDAQVLQEVFLNITGGKCYGLEAPCSTKDLSFITTATLQPDASKRIVTVSWLGGRSWTGDSTAQMLHFLPLTWRIDETSSVPASWTGFDFVYCHQGPFGTANELLEAFASGELRTCSAHAWGQPGYDASWGGLAGTLSLPATPGARPGPRKCSPASQRFTVSGLEAGGRSFRWLAWEGHVALRGGTGLALWDLKFAGDRVIYELAHQEMAVCYSGFADRGPWIVLDSSVGLGKTARTLRRGLDCPEDALYLDAVMWGDSGATTTSGALCMFEDDMAGSAWRHTSGSTAYGVRAVDLVIRSVSTLWNYDYIFDVRLKLDGSVDVRVTMAGVVLSLFHDPGGATEREGPFNRRVHTYVNAPLHDHLSNWKVDIDVAGTNNSFLKESVRSGSYEEALESAGIEGGRPAWAADYPLKYLARQRPQKELGLKVNLTEPAVWHFVNDASLNAWGQPRGYAIVPGSVSAQLLPDSHPVTKAAAWTKYQLAVTRQHDNETYSHASIYDQFGPSHPVVSLDSYIDGERIQGADLVGWVTLGMQHVTRSEDIPLIANVQTYFLIKPFNYFDRLASLNAAADDLSCATDALGSTLGSATQPLG